MSQGVGTIKPILGQVDTFGGHFWSAIGYSGPASYVQGGDSISPQSFGFNNSIFTLVGSVDGTAVVEAVPLALSVGSNPTYRILWRALTSTSVGGQGQTAGKEVVAGTNLSGFTVMLSAIGC